MGLFDFFHRGPKLSEDQVRAVQLSREFVACSRGLSLSALELITISSYGENGRSTSTGEEAKFYNITFESQVPLTTSYGHKIERPHLKVQYRDGNISEYQG